MGRILRPALALALVLAGVVMASLARSRDDGAEQGMHDVARLTSRMKTHCIGRFLVDMPEQAKVELGTPTIDGFNIAAFVETAEEFQRRLADREAEIRAKPDGLGGNNNLESETPVKSDNGIVGTIFVHSRKITEGTAAKGLELERYRYEGVALEALVHGSGISIDLAADYYDPDRIEGLARLVSQLVPNPGNTTPKEPGFCIDHAYFRDPLTADQGERITIFAGLPSYPDIDFLLILAAGTKPDEQGLLERSSASKRGFSLLERMRISTLRAAPRTIAGLPGEELVEAFSEKNDARVHSFWWEVSGTEDKVLVPHFVFKMNTGNRNSGPVPSSLSDDAALGLWDKILSSIRLRVTHPGTDPRTSPKKLSEA